MKTQEEIYAKLLEVQAQKIICSRNQDSRGVAVCNTREQVILWVLHDNPKSKEMTMSLEDAMLDTKYGKGIDSKVRQ